MHISTHIVHILSFFEEKNRNINNYEILNTAKYLNHTLSKNKNTYLFNLC